MMRFWMGAGLLIVLSGCFSPFTRFQSAEESERDKDLEVRTIGDVTEVADVGVLNLSGVGLVTGLPGTGDSPQGPFRKMLEEQFRKQKIEHIKALFDSPDNALVLVSARLSVGMRKGDPIDVEVTLPEGSRCTSLRGGYLQECVLRNYESTRNMKPDSNSDRLVQGHILARARGPLLVGLGNPDEPAELRRARIWEGGNSLTDRPYYMVMKGDDKSARLAGAVASRINLQFRQDAKRPRYLDDAEQQHLLLLGNVEHQLNKQFDPQAMGHGEVAKAMNKEMIALRVPYAYRLNPERYLRVARLVPLRESREEHPKYRPRLEKMLLDPQETVRGALRLEALGTDSQPILKKGLDSPYPLVRFTSAEALTYLGSAGGVEELGKLCEGDQFQPVRFYCLLAMANLNESVCRSRLKELLDQPDVELRSGAFLALRLLDGAGRRERDDPRSEDARLGGELLGESFWLHQVAPKSPPLVHVSLTKRAEIVLFGDDIRLVNHAEPVRILAGPEFTVTAAIADDRCTVSRFCARGSRQKQCSLQLNDVIRSMAELGAQYPDVVEFLRKADERRALSCPVRINTYPRQLPLEDLVRGGRDPHFLQE